MNNVEYHYGIRLGTREADPPEMRKLVDVADYLFAPRLEPDLLESIWCDTKAGATYEVTPTKKGCPQFEIVLNSLEHALLKFAGGHNGINGRCSYCGKDYYRNPDWVK